MLPSPTQAINNGYQSEQPDIWLQNGNPWEVKRNIKFQVGFGGKTEKRKGADGKEVSVWIPSEQVCSMGSPSQRNSQRLKSTLLCSGVVQRSDTSVTGHGEAK